MAFSEWELLARKLGTPEVRYVAKSWGSDLDQWYLVEPVIFEDVLSLVIVSTHSGPGNFPHGQNVEPDHT